VACALGVHAAGLQVFAAASLADVLKEIAPAYEAASGEKLQFNLAGSNALARQIQEGAPADVFISADEAKMDALQKAGLILDGTRQACSQIPSSSWSEPKPAQGGFRTGAERPLHQTHRPS